MEEESGSNIIIIFVAGCDAAKYLLEEWDRVIAE